MKIKNELYKYGQLFEIDSDKNLITLYVHPQFINNIKNIDGIIKLEYVKSVLEEESNDLEKT